MNPWEELDYAVAALRLARDRQQRRAAQRRIDALLESNPAFRAEVEYRSWCGTTGRQTSDHDFEVWMASRGFVRQSSDAAPGAGEGPSTPPSGEGRSAGADGPSPTASEPAAEVEYKEVD